MDLDYLTTFLEIAKQGSFSRAGQKLFRSQPAVSAQIRQLEGEYGQKLFDRSGQSMKLTAAAFVSMVRHGFNGDSDHGHVAHSPHTGKKQKATK
ncbi:MAG TPA: LysR family transcriptional regulator [Steroidobacteraceae bacterium]|nr:LysR family transcriptional regulator [Steroidobacteraceae bacterium]